MGADYEQQMETAMSVIDTLKAERESLEKVDTENPFITAFKKYENIDKLTRKILIELVEYIKVHEGGDISIKFKFADDCTGLWSMWKSTANLIPCKRDNFLLFISVCRFS